MGNTPRRSWRATQCVDDGQVQTAGAQRRGGGRLSNARFVPTQTWLSVERCNVACSSRAQPSCVRRLVLLVVENAMRTTIDAAGRIVVPKRLRDEMGVQPGQSSTLNCGTDAWKLRLPRCPFAFNVGGTGLSRCRTSACEP